MLTFKIRTRLLIKKLFNYEFWPYYIFYLPALFYGFYLALRSWSLAYFTAANPGLKYGGTFGMSKSESLTSLLPEYVPITLYFEKATTSIEIESEIQNKNLKYPIILKPDMGERGIHVEKINNINELQKYLSTNNDDFIVQEFVDYELEAGILYYRFPYEEKGNISSIVLRKFLQIKGDGKSTILDLILKNDRALYRFSYLINKYKDRLNEILSQGEVLTLEPIGNHNRGTEFLNGNNLINDKLIKVFHEISENINGFYYGRYDLKFKSFEDLYQGKNIKILEINGVNSEPAHIYDPSYKLIQAYIDVFNHMKIIYKISRYNNKNGIKYAKTKQFLTEMFIYARSK